MNTQGRNSLHNSWIKCGQKILYTYTYITGFVNLKIWTFALLLIKTQNRHFQKHLAPKFIENFSLPICYKITQKMFIFWLKKWRKMIITVISYGLPLGTNFVNICPYAGQICILWLMLRGAMAHITLNINLS